MPVSILFFARARDLTNTSKVEIEISDSKTTLEHIIKEIGVRFPELLKEPAPVLRNCAFALNEEYILKESFATTIVQHRDEVAIIPPVSGG